MKKHVKKGKTVSMGFGFVEFDSVETATGVCKDLQVALIPPLLFFFLLLSIKCSYRCVLNVPSVHREQFWMDML